MYHGNRTRDINRFIPKDKILININTLKNMIFERLADEIIKHSKLIIALWIVALMCAVPFMVKSFDVLSYDVDDMAGTDSESVQGMTIIKNNFYQSETTDMSSITLLVITYENSLQESEATQFLDKLVKDTDKYVDSDGNKKLSGISVLNNFQKENSQEGMILTGISYVNTIKASEIIDDVKDLRAWISEEIGETASYKHYVTGMPAINYDMEAGAMEDISHIDVFSILFILILVGLFFRSIFASAMPPITIGIAIAIAFCAVFFIGSITDIFFITEMFILVSMLGAGCDYCIFIIARYREERRKGNDHNYAIKESIIWAGESITTSGIAVMIGFGAMSVCSFSMIGNMGMMLAISIAIALFASLTLITAILNLIGEKIFWPSKIESFTEESKAMNGWFGKCSKIGHAYFKKSVHFSIKHAKAIVIASLLFTIPAAYVVISQDSSYDMIGTMLTGESQEGLDEIEEYTYGGLIMPNYEVLELGDTIGTVQTLSMSNITFGYLFWNAEKAPEYLSKLSTLSSEIYDCDKNVGDVNTIVSWKDLSDRAAKEIPKGSMTDATYIKVLIGHICEKYNISIFTAMTLKDLALNLDNLSKIPNVKLIYDDVYFTAVADYFMNYAGGLVGGPSVTNPDTNVVNIQISYVKISVVTVEQSMSDNSMKTLRTVDNIITDFTKNTDNMITNVWMTGTASVMYEISETVNQEFIKVITLAVILIFLLLFFVMKSYLTPLRSILTILMSVVWTIAITHLLFGNVLAEGVIWLIPVILVVICLGLGMDYDVLLTTRIKENYMHRGMSNDEAIVEAVIDSGPVITICGLIMGGAFGTLMMSGMVMLQEFGFALCFAILVDALIVRTYIVPAVMHLMGDWCWKGPKFLDRKEKE